MKPFYCQVCGERLYFENTKCLSCGSFLGFLPDVGIVAALQLENGGTYTTTAEGAEGKRYKACKNYHEADVCNWMIPADSSEEFCLSCRLNQIIPDLRVPENKLHWAKIEAAKRRLIHSLLRLNLPIITKAEDPTRGLAFEFLADPEDKFESHKRVLTGHASGLITINIAEADDAVRERMRLNMREVYRTLLGHFRHESGHYFWDRLFDDSANFNDFRETFGDERADYGEALQTHYQKGPPSDWKKRFVTPYAASHPWEDWAETWAHYLHIMDTLETAATNGLELRNRVDQRLLAIPYGRDFEAIRADWHALRFVLNSLNRSMGLNDPYPFVTSDEVAKKLSFIHTAIGNHVAARQSVY